MANGLWDPVLSLSAFGRPLAQEREPFGVCRLRCNLCQIVAKAGTQRGTMALKGTQDSAQHGRLSGCKFIPDFAVGPLNTESPEKVRKSC